MHHFGAARFDFHGPKPTILVKAKFDPEELIIQNPRFGNEVTLGGIDVIGSANLPGLLVGPYFFRWRLSGVSFGGPTAGPIIESRASCCSFPYFEFKNPCQGGMRRSTTFSAILSAL